MKYNHQKFYIKLLEDDFHSRLPENVGGKLRRRSRPNKKKRKKRKNQIPILSGKWGLSFAIVELCVVIYLACEG